MSFSTQKLHFSIKIPIQNYKQPSQTFTNDRTKSPQTTEKPKKIWTIQYKSVTLRTKSTTNKMMDNMYKPRIVDRLLARKLAGKGAVLIEGPKWCGKTTTARQQAKSLLDLGDTEVLKQSKQMMEISSKTLLQGETPRLIDEWQTITELWDTIRNEVDKRNAFSQFILTGSTVAPRAEDTVHSGTGRIGRVKMRPMSLYES
jgi:predicted AAA+ superfamily ATPase